MKTNNTPQEIKTILSSVATVLERIEAGEPDSMPLQNADKDKQDMWNLLHDCKASIKGIHACLNSMASDMYNHMDGSKHLPALNGYEHVDYACRQLGYGKERAIKQVAYANKKIIVG